MPKTINAAKLRRLKACDPQVELFVKLFGESNVAVTPELCAQHSSVFDWDWIAMHTLTAQALAEFIRDTAPALAEYDRSAQTLPEYERVAAQAWATLFIKKAP